MRAIFRPKSRSETSGSRSRNRARTEPIAGNDACWQILEHERGYSCPESIAIIFPFSFLAIDASGLGGSLLVPELRVFKRRVDGFVAQPVLHGENLAVLPDQMGGDRVFE